MSIVATDQHTRGHATIGPADDVVAGSMGTWRLTYVAGPSGIAQGGRLGVAWLWPCDWERHNFDRPTGSGYTTVSTSGQAIITPSFRRSLDLHPWDHVMTLTLSEGRLLPGEHITITFGDTSAGGPGMRAQTYQETTAEFHVLVAPEAGDEWIHLDESSSVRVIGGEIDRLILTGPTDVVVGEPFHLHVRADDRWNNPSPGYQGRVSLRMTPDADPATHAFTEGDGSVARLPARLEQPGIYRPVVTDDQGHTAEGNPIVCHASPPQYRRFWGDPHSGQTRAGCGAGTVEEHFRFMRDVANIDFGTHQGNDFMVSNDDWAETCRASREFNVDGDMVAFLGYEWSGDSTIGGDRNIIFLDDDQPIRRSNHALLSDRSDIDTDLPHVTDAHAFYAGKRVMIVPHVGGRPSDLTWHSPELEPVIEIHSGHGTNEWFLFDALARGYQVGVTSGSDDVMCRPGANYPGFADGRNTRGGITAVYATALTRDALVEAFRARRTVASTGERIVLWVEADGHPLGSAYTTAHPPRIHCDVVSVSGIERLELFRGAECVHAAPVVDWSDQKRNTLRVQWTGATERGTGGKSKLRWDGEMEIEGGRFTSIQPFGFDGNSDTLLETGDRLVRWRSVTALDSDGIVIEYDAPEDARIQFRSDVVTFDFTPADIGADPLVVDAGPVDRRVTVLRPPARPGPREYSFDFTDEQFPSGTSAYFVRVVQDDDEKAWSSPIYITREG